MASDNGLIPAAKVASTEKCVNLPVPVEDTVDENEATLARELRALCSIYGKERRATLPKSADVIMRLGELYLSKAENSTGMQKKLSFIRCCALLNGAKVRFEILKSESGISLGRSALSKFNAALLKACGNVGYSGPDVSDISSTVKKRVDALRSDARAAWSGITACKGVEGENEDVILGYVEKVRDEYEKTTGRYADLMSDIADKCISLIGAPKSKFVMVGLGSLARKEITLYSDFEHVIVLEDGVEDLPNYQEILEYFRWFAVIFQVIIIGLGETFIRSVGVKSINDLYSGDKEKNWFYDAYTPCGIAFDGMVPHSCMNPLGRQEATKAKTHVVELIQPASKMAQFLTSEAHLKNGYYLKDILIRTCFVYGDVSVYQMFQERSKDILTAENAGGLATEQLKKVKNNVNSFIKGDRMIFAYEHFDPKSTFYRPITALLAYLARLLNISTFSSFEIVDNLAKMDAINEKTALDLRYAVAKACQLRMESYALSGHQRFRVENNNLLNIVDKREAWVCYDAIRFLHITLTILGEEDCDNPAAMIRKFSDNFLINNSAGQILRLKESGRYKEGAELGEKARRLVYSISDYLELTYYTMECHYQLGMEQLAERESSFLKAEELCRYLISTDGCPGPNKADCFYLLLIMSKEQGRLEESLEFVKIWVEFCQSDNDQKADFEHNYKTVLSLEIEMMLKLEKPEQLVDYLSERVSKETNLENQYILKLGVAEARLKMGQDRQAKWELLQLVYSMRENISQMKLPALWMYRILNIQKENSWWLDQILTVQTLLDLPMHAGTVYDEEAVSRKNLDGHKLSALLQLDFIKSGLNHIEYMDESSKKEYKKLSTMFRAQKDIWISGNERVQALEVFRMSRNGGVAKEQSPCLHLLENLFRIGVLACEDFAPILWWLANTNARNTLGQNAISILLHVIQSNPLLGEGEAGDNVHELEEMFASTIEQARAFIALKCYRYGREILSDSAQDIRTRARLGGDPLVLLKRILETQKSNGWMDDALSTVELCLSYINENMSASDSKEAEFHGIKLDILYEQEKYKTGIAHIKTMSKASKACNAMTIVLFYTNQAMEEDDIDLVFELVDKSITICHEHPGEDDFTRMYAVGLSVLLSEFCLEYFDEAIQRFITAPDEVREHPTLDLKKVDFLFQFFESASTTHPVPTHQLGIVLRVFSDLIDLILRVEEQFSVDVMATLRKMKETPKQDDEKLCLVLQEKLRKAIQTIDPAKFAQYFWKTVADRNSHSTDGTLLLLGLVQANLKK